MWLNFKVRFAFFHTYGSRKQCTRPSQKNANAQSTAIQTQPLSPMAQSLVTTGLDSKVTHIIGLVAQVLFFNKESTCN